MICPVCNPRVNVGNGLQCPICGLVLFDKDDKSTGWALRALHAHHENVHDVIH